MIKVSYAEPDIILEAVDSEGGHILAIILEDKSIPNTKKKLDKGKLLISELKANELKDILKREKAKFERDESFLKFAEDMRRKEAEVVIKVKTVRSKIIGSNLPIADFQKATRFFMVAARNTQRFKEGKWDGYINLFDRRGNTFPTGLLQRITNILDKKKMLYRIEYLYDRFPEKQFEWEVIDGLIPDPDQIEAIKAAVKYGRGIVKAPTAFGNVA